MKKRQLHAVLYTLTFLLASTSISRAIAQDAPTVQRAAKQMNLFERNIDKIKKVYKEYKRCKTKECSPEDKAKLNQELKSLGKKAAVIAAGIITLITVSGLSAYYARKYYKKKQEEEKDGKGLRVILPDPETEEEEEEEREKKLEEQQKKEKEEEKQLEQQQLEQEQQRKLKEEEEKRELQKQELQKAEEVAKEESLRLEKETKLQKLKELEIAHQTEDQRQSVLKQIKDKFIDLAFTLKGGPAPTSLVNQLKNKSKTTLSLEETQKLLQTIQEQLILPTKAYIKALEKLQMSREIHSDQLTLDRYAKNNLMIFLDNSIDNAREAYKKGQISQAQQTINTAQEIFDKSLPEN